MREIKFRAWIRSYSGGPFTMLPKKNLKTEAVYLSWDMEVRPGIGFEDTVLMQYTGLKDKNGREIYEGDILESKDITGPVEWDEYYTCFTWIHSHMVNIHMSEGEVIGNIYENSELLK